MSLKSPSRRVYVLADALVRDPDARDMTVPQIAVLSILAAGDEAYRDLINRTGLAGPRITRTMDALIEYGYAEQYPHKSDRRKRIAAATETGKRLIGRIDAALALTTG